MEFDLRPWPGMDPNVLRAAIQQKLNPIAERHKVKIDYAPLFPEVPPFEQAEDCELVRVAERLTGHRAEAVAFGPHAPYLQRLGCETRTEKRRVGKECVRTCRSPGAPS